MRLATLALLLHGCAFELVLPSACETDAHCNSGRHCVDNRCVDENQLCVEPACALLSISPEVAREGDSVELEGIFGPRAQVRFPSGAVVTPDSFSLHRAQVTVPADAGAGDLVVTSGDRMVGARPFRTVAFSPTLSVLPQAGQASPPRSPPTLTEPRARFGVVAVGTVAYAIGGENAAGMAVRTVEQATLNADGTLSTFAPFASQLREARAGAAVVAAGGWVYVAGGLDAGGAALHSVERAPLASDGTLGPFESAGSLGQARVEAAAALVGNALVILGGRDERGAPTATVERALIDGHEMLGPFSGQTSLRVARAGAVAVVAEGALWVLGGSGSDGPLDSVERGALMDATITGFTLAAQKVTARERAAALHISRSLYLIGGDADGLPSASVERADFTGGELGAFSGAGSLAAPRSAAGLVRGDNGVHLLGGRGPSSALASTESLALDGSATLGPFQSTGTVAQARMRQSAVVLGRWLYLVGGRDASGTTVGETVRAPIAADGTVGTFAAGGPTLLHPRWGHRLAVVGRSLFVLGGANFRNAPELLVERAAIAADGSLEPFEPEPGAPMQTSRVGWMVAVMGGFLYALGGLDEMSRAVKEIVRAPLQPGDHLGPFETAGVLTVERFGAAQLVVGDTLYLAGGSNVTEVYRGLEQVRFADGALPTVATLPIDLVEPRQNAASMVLGGRWYLVGGFGTDGPLDSIESAPLASDGSPPAPFAGGPATTIVRNDGWAVVLGDFAYLLGGERALRPVDTVERAPLN